MWEPWQVDTYVGDTFVEFSLHSEGIEEYPAFYAHAPNWFERLFGITFEDKIHNARARAEKRRDFLNAQIIATRKAAERAGY
jgi:hypothetical protein